MRIKVYRGTHRIGGCITEIRTDRARIIIDIGAELPSAADTENQIEIDGVTCGKPDCDAVLVTHYHGDHVGMFDRVLSEVPIFMGMASKQIYGVVQEILLKKLGKGDPDRVASFKEYTAGVPMFFGDIKVTPYSIDHSAFDAHMFLIEAEGKRILHTGDFRMHGARGRKMPIVYEKYAKDIDVLITEGTMLSRLSEKVMTEHELGYIAKDLIRKNKYVFVLCSSTNIDTIAEFYNAAADGCRPFIVCEDDFQAEILRIVARNSKSPFYKFDKRKIYSYGKNLNSMMSERGFVFLGRINYTTRKAMEQFPNSLLIYSMWKGYLDKAHPAYDEYKSSFIENAVDLGCAVEYLHTSGHAGADDIKKVCRMTNARIIIPIHCETPETFKDLGLNGDVKVLQDGETFTL